MKDGEAVAGNRLAAESSPYLLQHAGNPVDWYPWGEEAFAAARRAGKPIFLSIGYSACHWCHVMERESFENGEIAAVLNRDFVSVKVDREERPDVDAIYMTAVQMLTGSGGWPMSVFLTPDLEPFYGGTYFPPEGRYGIPGFRELLTGIAAAWRDRRAEAERSAASIAGAVREAVAGGDAVGGTVSPAALEAKAAADLAARFDDVWGGFGGAPKFPQSGPLGLLLGRARGAGDERALRMATVTLEKMARGGMVDHLGGGFHRYAVDRQWAIPHFEKMLYDSALLSGIYCAAYQLTGDRFFRRVAAGTLDYVLRDLRDGRGGFHSAEDADSDGEEGRYYTWTPAEVDAVVGAGDGQLFAHHYGVTEAGNFAGRSGLRLADDLLALVRGDGVWHRSQLERLDAIGNRLLAARERRVRPGRDDKVVAAWNGWMISGLLQGYQALGAARYRDGAVAAGRFLRECLWRDGGLLRVYCRGRNQLPGVLDDYAAVANAAADLYESTFESSWLDWGAAVADGMIARFRDRERSGFFRTGDDQTHLIAREKPYQDGATPSGNAVAVMALLRLGRLLGRDAYVEMAERTIGAAGGLLERYPSEHCHLLRAAGLLDPTRLEVVIAGDGPDAAALVETVWREFVPHRVVARAGVGGQPGAPLAKGKGTVKGRPAAHVCRGTTCHAPVTEPAALRRLLRGEAE